MNNHCLTMKEIPESERPIEKGIRFGCSILSDAELLAVILRTGTQGENVLSMVHKIMKFGTSTDGTILSICKMSIKELQQIPGIGKVKATQLKCIVELAKRISKASLLEGISLTTPKSIADYYMDDLRFEKQEKVLIVMFNAKNQLLGEKILSVGTIDASLITPREIYIEALQKEAVNIVMLHNHPSGNPTPSNSDLLITKRVKDSGELIGIHLIDHIIIGNNKYISLKEKALM